MAEYHLHAKTHSRGAGKGAGGHARYVLRAGPYSKRTVQLVEGSHVRRVEESREDEVVYSASANMPTWAKNPVDYWDAADSFERANGTVYREIECALPKELSEEQNIKLASSFAEKLSAVPGGHTPYTLAIHKSEKNPDLLHCHLMLSDKVNDGIDRDPALWFRRAANLGKDPARGGAPKTQARISQEWLKDTVRPLWEQLANDALAKAGHDASIDRRTLEARRIEQERLAEAARQRGDVLGAVRHEKAAMELDRPPQPKRGRVLEHGGQEKAPAQALQMKHWEQKRARRIALRAAVAAASIELERVEREIAAVKRQQQQRREAARLETMASRREPVPDRLAIGQAVAGWIATKARQWRADVQRRWAERRQQRASAAIHDLSSPKLVSSKPARPTAAVDLPSEMLAVPEHGRLRIDATVLAVTDDALVIQHAGREKYLRAPTEHLSKMLPGQRVALLFADGQLRDVQQQQRAGHDLRRGPQR
jgi:hypothetical protein